jgi:hypothetical protein
MLNETLAECKLAPEKTKMMKDKYQLQMPVTCVWRCSMIYALLFDEV